MEVPSEPGYNAPDTIENIKEARKPLYTSKHGDERAGMGFTIMENFMDKLVCEKIKKWQENPLLDEKLKEELASLDEEKLNDAFYTDLEFGTGGLRGVLGVGTNRMNI